MGFPDLSNWSVIGFDTETTGLNYPTDRAFGFSVASKDGSLLEYYDLRQTPRAVKWWNDQMKSYRGTIVCHNASFDYLMGKNSGLKTPLEQMDDTAIRACLIDEHRMTYDLDALSWDFLGEGKEEPWAELAAMFGGKATRNAQALNLQHAPYELARKYAVKDPLLTVRLWHEQEKQIDAQNDTNVPLRSIIDFERNLMPTIIRAQERGVRVDLEQAERAVRELTPIIFQEQDELNEIAGWDFNVNSGPQVKKLFSPEKIDGRWVANDGTVLQSTKSGGPSFGAGILRDMKHPAAQKIYEIRSLIKTRDTFLRGHILGSAVGDRVYPNINQTKGEDGGTGTGRFSYTDPALQQIPSRNKKVAEIVKSCFLPDEGHIWCETDKDTFEVRVFASLAGVPRMLRAYQENPDLDGHQFVADLTGLPRNPEFSGQANSKQLNLGMIFNMGNGAIADNMGLPTEPAEFTNDEGKIIKYIAAGPEAMAAIQKYHRYMPGVKELAQGCKNVALRRGFVRTAMGRRLRFPGGYKAYKASGLLIQATAADLNKENWMIIEQALGGEGHLILNTHDSYGMSLPEDNWYEPFRRVRDAIQKEGRISVPLRLGLDGCGDNWWSAINDKYGANERDKRPFPEQGDNGLSRSPGVHRKRPVRSTNKAKRKAATS